MQPNIWWSEEHHGSNAYLLFHNEFSIKLKKSNQYLYMWLLFPINSGQNAFCPDKKFPQLRTNRWGSKCFTSLKCFWKNVSLISLHKLVLQLFERGKILVRLGLYSICYNKNYLEPKQATMAGINLPWKHNSWLQNQQLSLCNLFLFYSVNYVFIFVTLCLKH